MTPKQALVAHLETQHGEHVHRGTHQHLKLRHRVVHQQHLTHTHHPSGWATGGEQMEVKISLCPPKNVNSTRNGDRNWVLNIANLSQGTGHRWEMAGTREYDIPGAKSAADKLLGYEANWVAVGWGFEHRV
jgi:hypothetical protein